MKKDKIIYWSATTLIVLFEGLMPALTSQTELAKEGIRHLGYPEYFGNALVVFKVLGVLALIVPQIPIRLKEWAYAGLAFDFIFRNNLSSFFQMKLFINYFNYLKILHPKAFF